MHFHIHRPSSPSGPGGGGPTLPLPAELSKDLRFLQPAEVTLRQEGSRLQMLRQEEGSDEEWFEVTLVRLFPLSEPESWISVVDGEGQEIGILRDLKGMAPNSLHLVREALNRRYLVPAIVRILSCQERFDVVEWEVETDRGRTSFMTRNAREQAQEPLPRRLVLTDVEGNRWDVPDVEALDRVSRRWLEERL